MSRMGEGVGGGGGQDSRAMAEGCQPRISRTGQRHHTQAQKGTYIKRMKKSVRTTDPWSRNCDTGRKGATSSQSEKAEEEGAARGQRKGRLPVQKGTKKHHLQIL